MRKPLVVLGIAFFFSMPVLAQTNVLTNGSLESALTGWTPGQHLEAGGLRSANA